MSTGLAEGAPALNTCAATRWAPDFICSAGREARMQDTTCSECRLKQAGTHEPPQNNWNTAAVQTQKNTFGQIAPKPSQR